MQHPIGEHALLADMRTAALIDPEGNVAWLCWPRIDSTPLLFSILDEQRGGSFSVRPAAANARVLSRRYHPRSLVLETTWDVGGARLIVEDALDLGANPILLRRLRAQGDDIDVAVGVRAPRWDTDAATMRITGDALEVTGAARVAIRAPGAWDATNQGAVSHLVVHPGESVRVTLGAPGTDPDVASIDATLVQWHRLIPDPMAGEIDPEGSPNDTALVRELLGTSAAVLTGLRRSGGGIVAAPTTSLPQWPGSARTWDYRYSWLRDSSLAGIAMLRLGLVEAAHGLGAFIGEVVTEHGPVPLVRVDGTAAPVESERHDLAGYRGARPVRIGNAAAAQAQLDVSGEVIELAVALAAQGALPDALRSAVPLLAGWLTGHWRDPDNAIWEIRGVARRYTHSLVTALSGLAGGAALAETGVVAGDSPMWRATAAAIAAELAATTGAMQLRRDGGGADAALSQLALLGGLESVGPRVAATLDLIIERLDRNGLIDRYEGQPDTLDDPCAPFVFPTFWLAAALAATGRHGTPFLKAALATRGPLGLFGEVADPADRTPLGNYPQVQSHAAFVLAVTRATPRP